MNQNPATRIFNESFFAKFFNLFFKALQNLAGTGGRAIQNFPFLILIFLLAITTSYAQFDAESRWNRLIDFFKESYTRGDYEYSLKLAEKALAVAEVNWGENSLKTAVSSNYLGLACYQLKRYQEAESSFLRTIAIMEENGAAEQSVYATSLSNLAALKNDLGNFEKAETLFKKALEIRAKMLDPAYLESLLNLSVFYWQQERHDEAQKFALQASAQAEKVHGKNSPAYARCLNNHAIIYHRQGFLDEANSLYKQAIVILQQAGPEHKALLSTVTENRAKALKALLEAKKSEDHFSLTFFGSFLQPKRMLRENYSPGSSISLGFGYYNSLADKAHTPQFMMNILYSRDAYALKRGLNNLNNVTAINSSLHLEFVFGLGWLQYRNFGVSTNLGYGLGGSRFSIDGDDFDALGGTTLTELAGENKKIQYSSYPTMGVTMTAVNHLALNYGYDLMTTQRAYLLGHQVLSGAIQFLPFVAFDQFGKLFLSVKTRKSLLYNSLVFCSQVGLFIFVG